MKTRIITLVAICCLTTDAFAQAQQSSVELLAVGAWDSTLVGYAFAIAL